MGFLDHFDPFRAARTVADIDYGELWDAGVRGLIFDLENTLALYRASSLVDGYLDLLRSLQAKGLALGIVSNSARDWVAAVVDPLGIPFVGKAGKPRAAAFQTVLDRLPVAPSEVAVVGDQRLTDVCPLGLRLLGRDR